MEGEERFTALVVMGVILGAVILVFIIFALVYGKENGGLSIEIFGSYLRSLINIFR